MCTCIYCSSENQKSVCIFVFSVYIFFFRMYSMLCCMHFFFGQEKGERPNFSGTARITVFSHEYHSLHCHCIIPRVYPQPGFDCGYTNLKF